MISTAEKENCLIDCSKIIFRASFFQLSRQEVSCLAKEYYQFVHDCLPSCVLSWKERGKPVVIHEDWWNKKAGSSAIFFGFVGEVKSEKVYNKKTMTSYTKKIWIPNNPYDAHIGVSPLRSVDYDSYIHQNVECYSDNQEKYKRAISCLFDTEYKKNINLYLDYDASGYFTYISNSSKHNSCVGEFIFEIASYCLCESEDRLVYFMFQFAEYCARKHSSISLSIERNSDSVSTVYLQYFPVKKSVSNAIQNSIFLHYAKHFYLTNVGWANFVSPIQREKLDRKSQITKGTSSSQVRINELSNGGLCLHINKPIFEATIQDLKEIKREIYSLLFPGESVWGRPCRDIRSRWEIIPILEDELSVTESQIILQHKYELDETLIFSLFS